MTIASEIQRFLDFHQARSIHTARAYRSGLDRFQAYLTEKSIDVEGSPDALTRQVATDFLVYLSEATYEVGDDQRPLSMRTRQLYVRAVSGLYRLLAQEGKIPLSYADYVALKDELSEATRFKDVPIEKKLPGADAVAAIITYADAEPAWSPASSEADKRRRLIWLRNRAIIHLLSSSGMRVGELCALRIEDLSDQGAWVTGKGQKQRFVRFGKDAWTHLQAYLKYRGTKDRAQPLICRHDTGAGNRVLPLSTLSVQRIVTRLADGAGVEFHLTPHSFRHFFATMFLQRTGDLALTQDALGHADPRTTRVYAKVTKEQIEAAHAKIFG